MEMTYYCSFCGNRLTRRRRKYCNNTCKCRWFHKQHPEKCNLWNKEHPRPKINNSCFTCGKLCGRKKYCSNECKPIIFKELKEPEYFKKIERINVRCAVCEGLIFIPSVHHINGNHKDNRKENLTILCPSCHSKVHSLKLPKNIKKDEKEIQRSLDKLREKLVN